MKKYSWILVAAAVLLVFCLFWLGGVALSAVRTSAALERELWQFNEQLSSSAPGGLLKLRLNSRYEVLDRHFFSEEGLLVLEIDDFPESFKVSTKIQHGFLYSRGRVDFSAAAANLLAVRGILDPGIKAFAEFKTGIFPRHFDLKLKFKGVYNQAWEARVCRGLRSGRPLQLDFFLHRQATGRISSYLNARELLAPWGCLSRFEAKTRSAPGHPGSLSFSGRGLEAPGMLFSELATFRVSLEAVPPQSGTTFRVDYAARGSGRHGSLNLSGSLGPFDMNSFKRAGSDGCRDSACRGLSGNNNAGNCSSDGEDLGRSGSSPGSICAGRCNCDCRGGGSKCCGRMISLLDLAANPQAAGLWFAKETATLRLEHFLLAADFTEAEFPFVVPLAPQALASDSPSAGDQAAPGGQVTGDQAAAASGPAGITLDVVADSAGPRALPDAGRGAELQAAGGTLMSVPVPVQFVLSTRGEMELPRIDDFARAAGRINGFLEVSFSPRSAGAEQLLQAAGGVLFVKDVKDFFVKKGEQYFARLEFQDGRMLINGIRL